jgi:hypothetical protein
VCTVDTNNTEYGNGVIEHDMSTMSTCLLQALGAQCELRTQYTIGLGTLEATRLSAAHVHRASCIPTSGGGPRGASMNSHLTCYRPVDLQRYLPWWPQACLHYDPSSYVCTVLYIRAESLCLHAQVRLRRLLIRAAADILRTPYTHGWRSPWWLHAAFEIFGSDEPRALRSGYCYYLYVRSRSRRTRGRSTGKAGNNVTMPDGG